MSKWNYEMETSMTEIVTLTDMKFLICSCYGPRDAYTTWKETLEMIFRGTFTQHSKIVNTSDFNLLRACWNWLIDASAGNEHNFVSLLNDFFLDQVNTTSTRGDSTLDLMITSTPERVKVIEVLKPI